MRPSGNAWMDFETGLHLDHELDLVRIETGETLRELAQIIATPAAVLQRFDGALGDGLAEAPALSERYPPT